MQVQNHDVAFGLFGENPTAQVALTDTDTDPRLIVNAPLFQSATILDHVQTWHEAIERGGLDFEVVKRPIAFRNDAGGYKRLPDVFATVRSDNDTPLGVVKGRYQVIQNRVGGEMVDVLLDDGSAKIVAAGSWALGALGFVVAKIPADVTVGGVDNVQSFLVIDWSHDGSRPWRASIRMIRPACANTFPVIVFSKSVKNAFTLRHTGSIEGKIEQARSALGIGFAASAYFGQQAETLLAQKITPIDAMKMTELLIPNPKGDDGEVASRLQNRRDAIVELFANSPNLQNVGGTAWAYVNAVAEYADHVMPARETKKTSREENRAISTFVGAADRMKRHAFAIAREF